MVFVSEQEKKKLENDDGSLKMSGGLGSTDQSAKSDDVDVVSEQKKKKPEIKQEPRDRVRHPTHTHQPSKEVAAAPGKTTIPTPVWKDLKKADLAVDVDDRRCPAAAAGLCECDFKVSKSVKSKIRPKSLKKQFDWELGKKLDPGPIKCTACDEQFCWTDSFRKYWNIEHVPHKPTCDIDDRRATYDNQSWLTNYQIEAHVYIL